MGAGTGIPLSLPESAIKGTALSGAPMTPIAAHTKNLFGVLPSFEFIIFVKTKSIKGKVIHPIAPPNAPAFAANMYPNSFSESGLQVDPIIVQTQRADRW